MANYQWRASHVQCPYYLTSWDRCITCGSKDENLRRKFPDTRRCSDYFKRYCSQQYERCQHLSLVKEIAG